VRRRATLVAWAALSLTFLAWPAAGQIFRYMAFGDSETLGAPPFDPAGLGYPGRLDDLLNCFPPNCEVINEGLGGEKTFQGVTRIETLLDADPWDVVLLMEGINDVHLEFSNASIIANLGLMDIKARDHGVDTLHGSNIHLDPDSESGMIPAKRAQIAALRDLVETLAANRNRYFADPWTPLCPNNQCFNQHYYQPGGGEINTVGHPDPSGFDIMADEFRDAIVSSPVPAVINPVAPIGTIDDLSPDYVWTREVAQNATWYQFRILDEAMTIIVDEWEQVGANCSGSTCTRSGPIFEEGDYTWEVRGRNPRGRSAWVSTPFTILTLLPPTELVPTAPETYTAETEPLFQWERETPRVAATYRLEVSDSVGVIFDQVYSTFAACAANPDCTVDPFNGAPLSPAELYSWRVQGANAAGTGPWTAKLEFEVEPNLIFFDGFESGDLTAWSTAVP